MLKYRLSLDVTPDSRKRVAKHSACLLLLHLKMSNLSQYKQFGINNQLDLRNTAIPCLLPVPFHGFSVHSADLPRDSSKR